MRCITRLLLLLGFCSLQTAFGQGRVVINEYMPWTLNGCGTTAEFVELYNFGPGAADISCYILTDGDYSVTIPQGTILEPGQYYVIAGQDVIAAPCANINGTVYADLNWNTCGCTSDFIPTTGDGFFTDGGSASEQVVLLDPDLNVVDAVVRDLPVEPSREILPASNGCSIPMFDLDNMNIQYETLGMSTGRGNSFARKLDGDCGWVKDPQQSAGATNNTPSDVSDVTYTFSYVEAMDCSGSHGSVNIHVKKSSYDNFFPMRYTIALDVNEDGRFDAEDEYTVGYDSTAPNILIGNLPAGRYCITVESLLGCSLESFLFTILPCQTVLPVNLVYFRHHSSGGKLPRLEWAFAGASELISVMLEKSGERGAFTAARSYPVAHSGSSLLYQSFEETGEGFSRYRLQMKTKEGRILYSPELRISGAPQQEPAFGPNPVTNQLQLRFGSRVRASLPYQVVDATGKIVKKGQCELQPGTNQLQIPLANLPVGMYQFQALGAQPISFRFVKQ